MVEYGRRKVGLKQRVSEGLTLELGKLYDVKVEVEGLIDPQTTADYIVRRMSDEYPNIAITWIRVSEIDQTIEIQLSPIETQRLGTKSLSIAGILLFLPQILTLLGIVVVGISIWSVISAVPWWAWGLLGTGVFLWLFGPSIGKMFGPQEPTVLPIAYRRAY